MRACDRVEAFEDLGKSGGKLKGRRDFHRLLERIKAELVDVRRASKVS